MKKLYTLLTALFWASLFHVSAISSGNAFLIHGRDVHLEHPDFTHGNRGGYRPDSIVLNTPDEGQYRWYFRPAENGQDMEWTWGHMEGDSIKYSSYESGSNNPRWGSIYFDGNKNLTGYGTSKNIFQYDENNQLYKLGTCYYYTYDDQGNLLNLYPNLDEYGGDNDMDLTELVCVYDNQGHLAESFERYIWDSEKITDYRKYTCNERGDVIRQENVRFDVLEKVEFTYDYDKNGEPILKTKNQYFKKSVDDEWQSSSAFEYFYTILDQDNTTNIENEIQTLDVKMIVTDKILKVEAETASITIYNLSGNLLVQQNSSNECNLSEFPEGIYILKAILKNGEVVTKKIILG